MCVVCCVLLAVGSLLFVVGCWLRVSCYVKFTVCC